jgi:hypothetical protein
VPHVRLSVRGPNKTGEAPPRLFVNRTAKAIETYHFRPTYAEANVGHPSSSCWVQLGHGLRRESTSVPEVLTQTLQLVRRSSRSTPALGTEGSDSSTVQRNLGERSGALLNQLLQATRRPKSFKTAVLSPATRAWQPGIRNIQSLRLSGIVWRYICGSPGLLRTEAGHREWVVSLNRAGHESLKPMCTHFGPDRVRSLCPLSKDNPRGGGPARKRSNRAQGIRRQDSRDL